MDNIDITNQSLSEFICKELIAAILGKKTFPYIDENLTNALENAIKENDNSVYIEELAKGLDFPSDEIKRAIFNMKEQLKLIE